MKYVCELDSDASVPATATLKVVRHRNAVREILKMRCKLVQIKPEAGSASDVTKNNFKLLLCIHPTLLHVFTIILCFDRAPQSPDLPPRNSFPAR